MIITFSFEGRFIELIPTQQQTIVCCSQGRWLARAPNTSYMQPPTSTNTQQERSSGLLRRRRRPCTGADICHPPFAHPPNPVQSCRLILIHSLGQSPSRDRIHPLQQATLKGAPRNAGHEVHIYTRSRFCASGAAVRVGNGPGATKIARTITCMGVPWGTCLVSRLSCLLLRSRPRVDHTSFADRSRRWD